MDREIVRDLWQGKLPLCFKLDPDDVDGMHQPDPYYMMVSRVTYFPLVLDRVVKYFSRFIDQKTQALNDMWLDYEGQPIKWHHPIGLSWDLFCSNCDLPWHLILHFKNFPQTLLKCNNKASIESNFISTIKEADTLKHKRSVMRSMVKKDQNQLWTSIVNDKFDQFYAINKRLMERSDNELFRYIPFRMYLPDYTYIQKVIKPCTKDKQIFRHSPSTSQTSIKANPIAPLYDYGHDNVIKKTFKCSHAQSLAENSEECRDHRSTTMLDLIQTCFSDRIDQMLKQDTFRRPSDAFSDRISRDEIHHEAEEEADEEKIEDNKKLSLEELQRDPIDVELFKYRFISHGIEIPFDTPLQWLSEHFSYPDNFLHICAVNKDQY